MVRTWIWPLLAAATLLSACQAPAQSGAPPSAPAAHRELRVGDTAPDFTLMDQNRQQVTLSQFRGQTVQLAFYVWAFSSG
jgi:cytochrome oxidase Cu insertion factor (SCO1/SenC/PrrC family)